MTGTAYSRTFKRAADTVGGVAELARKLGVAVPELGRWIAGQARPPQEIFLAALDIVSGVEQLARRSQDFANRSRKLADRAQAAADRAQASAERAHAHADRMRRSGAPQRANEQLRRVTADEQQPASNQAPDRLKKDE